MTDPLGTIRQQVQKLLKARPDLQQQEFGRAVGRGPSWVSAFLAGRRDANETILLVRIARYFGVTAGYLLNETDRRRDASTMMLLSAWERLTSQKDRDAVLQLAVHLQARGPEDGGEPIEPPDAHLPTTRRIRRRSPKAPARKRP